MNKSIKLLRKKGTPFIILIHRTPSATTIRIKGVLATYKPSMTRLPDKPPWRPRHSTSGVSELPPVRVHSSSQDPDLGGLRRLLREALDKGVSSTTPGARLAGKSPPRETQHLAKDVFTPFLSPVTSECPSDTDSVVSNCDHFLERPPTTTVARIEKLAPLALPEYRSDRCKIRVLLQSLSGMPWFVNASAHVKGIRTLPAVSQELLWLFNQMNKNDPKRGATRMKNQGGDKHGLNHGCLYGSHSDDDSEGGK